VISTSGERHVLYGVSVFAVQPGRTEAEVLERFGSSPSYLALRAGTLRSARFDLFATGTNPDHFDVQLMPGAADDAGPSIADQFLSAAASRLVALAGRLLPNPAYSGTEQPAPEEDR